MIFTFQSLFDHAAGFLLAHFVWLFFIVLAVLIIRRMINERRRPSNVFAWAIFMLVFPVLGVLLYFLFGGRKSRRLAGAKREIYRWAAESALRAGGKASGQALETRFAGNRFTLLGDGVAAYETLCRQIEGAGESIHILTYILGGGKTGRQLVRLLEKKAQEGVRVRLLMDAYGSFGKFGKFTHPLRLAGGEVAAFMPMLHLHTEASAHLRNHRKLAIFDGERAIVGGQNIDRRFISDAYGPELFLDFSALLEGPVVGALNWNFIADWVYAAKADPRDFEKYFLLHPGKRGESDMEVIASGPDVEGDLLWERIITLVQECQESVTIVTPYFIPDEVLLYSLIVKAHGKRRIRIILPEKSNHPVTDAARNHFLRQLHAEGVEILLFQDGMIHAKLMLVDSTVGLIGSANFDFRSLFVNFEIGILHTSRRDLEALEGWVGKVLPHCRPYEESTSAQYGPFRRTMEDFAHLLIPLL